MSRINKSCHVWIGHVTYEWVMSRMNESHHTWTSHVTHERVMSHMNESCHTWTSHVTHERVMSHINAKHGCGMSHIHVLYHIWVRHINTTYEHVISISHLNTSCHRPTQSIMYVPLQVNRSQKCILLIIQYKYIKSCSGDLYSPESDPPHKIMRYWVYYSTLLCFGFPPDRICQAEMICIGGVPVLKRHFGGAGS